MRLATKASKRILKTLTLHPKEQQKGDNERIVPIVTHRDFCF